MTTVQTVEVVELTPGWVEFVDPNGLAGMDWDTARLLYRTARNADSGRVFSTVLRRWFDRDVLAFVVDTLDRQPVCQEPDGRGLCEDPADPNSLPHRCTQHDGRV